MADFVVYVVVAAPFKPDMIGQSVFCSLFEGALFQTLPALFLQPQPVPQVVQKLLKYICRARLFFGSCFFRPGLWRVAALALCRAAVPVCAALSSSACIGCRPRLCRVAAPICVALSSAVCVVSPFRFADGRRRRILRTVWRGICADCGSLAAFPCVATIPVGSPARFFVALNFQISFYFRTFARL